MQDLFYFYGKPAVKADLRTHNRDFIVQEILPFAPSGEGEHHMLHIRKEGLNTIQVAELIAKFAKVHPKEVTYAGQKDKHAITEQWFGVRIPGKENPEWTQLNDEQVEVISFARHGKKLRIGALVGNRFKLTLRNVSDVNEAQARIEKIMVAGVPNYFGEQRFGKGGRNLVQGRQMLSGRKVKDRNKRSMYLSAVRSFLFNQVVSDRLKENGIEPLEGDSVMLSGSKSFFTVEAWNDENLSRLACKDIQLSAPMWGRGQVLAQGVAAKAEAQALSDFEQDCAGLENAGLNQERRPLLLEPQGMKYSFEGNTLVLEFVLPAGSFATSVLRELFDYQDVQAKLAAEFHAQKTLLAEQKAALKSANNDKGTE